MTDVDEPLTGLEVLFVDCQATGADPERSHPFEIAWGRGRAGDPAIPEVVARLVRLPRGDVLPPRVEKLTGLSTEELRRTARTPADAWREFACAAGAEAPMPIVAHFSRYEEAHLRALHARFGNGETFRFELLCTHEIARRLFPDLPRRGLAPLAGFFGHPLGNEKRAASHVEATSVVWKNVVELLAPLGITTLRSLRLWLAEDPPRRSARRAYPMERERRLDLPAGPGVYRFLGGAGELLYVGKATSLRARVNSYFQKRAHAADRTLELLTRARDVRVTETGSSLEAALLEAETIQREKPPYNVSLSGPDREIRFWSRGFAQSRTRPTSRHTIGPIPSRFDLGALARIAEAVARKPDKLDAERILGTPPEIAPEQPLFEQGVRLFSERLAIARPSSRELLEFGHLAAKERLRALDLAASQPESTERELDDPETPEIPAGWTPERVAGALEGLVLHAAHLVRRGTWLGWLVDSVIAFDDGKSRRLLVFERGRVSVARHLAPNESIPAPRNPARPHSERNREFDRALYDRLRVLTTELRVVLRNGGQVEIALDSRRRIRRERLSRFLRWV